MTEPNTTEVLPPTVDLREIEVIRRQTAVGAVVRGIFVGLPPVTAFAVARALFASVAALPNATAPDDVFAVEDARRMIAAWVDVEGTVPNPDAVVTARAIAASLFPTGVAIHAVIIAGGVLSLLANTVPRIALPPDDGIHTKVAKVPPHVATAAAKILAALPTPEGADALSE